MRERYLHVHYLPQFVAEDQLAGSTVVVVDLLRASTTICQALAAGAREVMPLLEVSDAQSAAVQCNRSEILLGGERGGRRIEGFDLGNSPAEYTPKAVAGRRVLLTTTNGTRALYHARTAKRVLVGSFVNLAAVVASVRDEQFVNIVCAGTAGEVTRDDILAAGAMVEQLCSAAGDRELNEAAESARREWQVLIDSARAHGRPPREQLAIELRATPGGRNLLAIGLDADLVDCAEIDKLSVVPELDANAWRITLP